MVKISITYEGNLRVKATHQPSQEKLRTDAPVDNEGKGESFSPTDLLATSLGSCMATTMGIVARRNAIELKGMQIEVEKIMSSDPPRRVATLNVEIKIPISLQEDQKKLLENTALHCPVAISIHPETKLNTRFVWKT
jgi:uncharacterized OsmC-like protein